MVEHSAVLIVDSEFELEPEELSLEAGDEGVAN